MSYRPIVLAAAVAALSSMHIASAAAQSVYVAPGGVYIGAGAGPVYVTPPAPTNGTAAYIGPGYGRGYGAAAYIEPGYDNGYEAAAYVESGYDNGYGPGPYVAPRYGYGYGPAVPNRRYYSGPRSAYAAALPPRPRVAVPHRSGRCVGRH